MLMKSGLMKTAPVLFALLLAPACGVPSEPATYTVSCTEVTCDSPTEETVSDSSLSQSQMCRWDCADYKEQSGVSVTLRFQRLKKEGECFVLSDEEVTEGKCDSPYHGF